MSTTLENLWKLESESVMKRVEANHEAWVKAGKPSPDYFGTGTFPSLEDKAATELSDEWQGVRPHEETIYVRVA